MAAQQQVRLVEKRPSPRKATLCCFSCSRCTQLTQSQLREATRLDLRVKHASNELMNATSAPVVLAAFEDPDEVSMPAEPQ